MNGRIRLYSEYFSHHPSDDLVTIQGDGIPFNPIQGFQREVIFRADVGDGTKTITFPLMQIEVANSGTTRHVIELLFIVNTVQVERFIVQLPLFGPGSTTREIDLGSRTFFSAPGELEVVLLNNRSPYIPWSGPMEWLGTFGQQTSDGSDCWRIEIWDNEAPFTGVQWTYTPPQWIADNVRPRKVAQITLSPGTRSEMTIGRLALTSDAGPPPNPQEVCSTADTTVAAIVPEVEFLRFTLTADVTDFTWQVVGDAQVNAGTQNERLVFTLKRADGTLLDTRESDDITPTRTGFEIRASIPGLDLVAGDEVVLYVRHQSTQPASESITMFSPTCLRLGVPQSIGFNEVPAYMYGVLDGQELWRKEVTIPSTGMTGFVVDFGAVSPFDHAEGLMEVYFDTDITNLTGEQVWEDTPWTGQTAPETAGGEGDEFTVRAPGAIIKYDNQAGDIFSPIISSTADFTMMLQDQVHKDFVDEVATTADDFRWSVVIKRNDVPYWFGKLLVDQMEILETHDPVPVTFTATDNLGILKDIDYDFLTDDGLYVLQETITEHLFHILKATDVRWENHEWLRIATQWRSQEHPTPIDDALALTYIEHRVFVTGTQDGRPKFSDYYEVLEHILRSFGLRIMMSEGYWTVQGVWDIQAPSYVYYLDNPRVGRLEAGDGEYTMKARHIEGTFSYHPALRYTKVNFSYTKGFGLITNDGDLRGGITLTNVTGQDHFLSFQVRVRIQLTASTAPIPPNIRQIVLELVIRMQAFGGAPAYFGNDLVGQDGDQFTTNTGWRDTTQRNYRYVVDLDVPYNQNQFVGEVFIEWVFPQALQFEVPTDGALYVQLLDALRIIGTDPVTGAITDITNIVTVDLIPVDFRFDILPQGYIADQQGELPYYAPLANNALDEQEEHTEVDEITIPIADVPNDPNAAQVIYVDDGFGTLIPSSGWQFKGEPTYRVLPQKLADLRYYFRNKAIKRIDGSWTGHFVPSRPIDYLNMVYGFMGGEYQTGYSLFTGEGFELNYPTLPFTTRSGVNILPQRGQRPDLDFTQIPPVARFSGRQVVTPTMVGIIDTLGMTRITVRVIRATGSFNVLPVNVSVKDGQELFIIDAVTGASQRVTVDGDQSLSTGTLNLQPFNPITNFAPGSVISLTGLPAINTSGFIGGGGTTSSPLQLRSDGQAADLILVTDGSGQYRLEPKPSGGGSTGDNWGSQVVETESFPAGLEELEGDGTVASPLKITGIPYSKVRGAPAPITDTWLETRLLAATGGTLDMRGHGRDLRLGTQTDALNAFRVTSTTNIEMYGDGKVSINRKDGTPVIRFPNQPVGATQSGQVLITGNTNGSVDLEWTDPKGLGYWQENTPNIITPTVDAIKLTAVGVAPSTAGGTLHYNDAGEFFFRGGLVIRPNPADFIADTPIIAINGADITGFEWTHFAIAHNDRGGVKGTDWGYTGRGGTPNGRVQARTGAFLTTGDGKAYIKQGTGDDTDEWARLLSNTSVSGTGGINVTITPGLGIQIDGTGAGSGTSLWESVNASTIQLKSGIDTVIVGDSTQNMHVTIDKQYIRMPAATGITTNGNRGTFYFRDDAAPQQFVMYGGLMVRPVDQDYPNTFPVLIANGSELVNAPSAKIEIRHRNSALSIISGDIHFCANPGNPNGKVTGNFGDLLLDVDGRGWLKEGDNLGNTQWERIQTSTSVTGVAGVAVTKNADGGLTASVDIQTKAVPINWSGNAPVDTTMPATSIDALGVAHVLSVTGDSTHTVHSWYYLNNILHVYIHDHRTTNGSTGIADSVTLRIVYIRGAGTP